MVRLLIALAPLSLLLAPSLGCEAQEPSLAQAAGVASRPALDWSAPPALGASASCDEAAEALRAMASTHARLEVERNRRAWADTRSVGGGDPLDSPLALSGPLQLVGSDAGAGAEIAGLATSDGTHLLAVVDQDLLIVRAASPDGLAELGRVTLAGEPRGVAEVGGRVIAVSYLASERASLVTVIDLADPSAPVVVAKQAYEGGLRSLQVVAGRVLLVLTSRPEVPGVATWPEDLDPGAGAATAARAFSDLEAANEAAIAAAGIEELMPRRFEVAWNGAVNRNSGRLLGSCQGVLAPQAYSGAGVLTAVTLEPGGPAPATPTSTFSVLGRWDHLETAGAAVYLASSNWGYFWLWPADDKPDIVTHIHKLAVDERGNVVYRGSGTAAGYGAQARPMDESAGRLRIATTNGDLWWGWGYAPQAETLVTVLEEAGGRLETVGLVAVAAEAPSLQTLFAGALAYVVPLDSELPLLVLDLASPATPRLAGWIAGAGAWARVLPVGPGQLATVTRLDDADGVLELSLHDVSDPAAPFVVDSLAVAAAKAGSQVDWDETAAAYFPSAELMALPVEVTTPTREGWWAYEPSLRLFRVGAAAGVSPAGTLSHLSLVPNGDGCSGKGAAAAIAHAVVLGDYLYAVSRVAVTATRLDALSKPPEATVLLGPAPSPCAAGSL